MVSYEVPKPPQGFFSRMKDGMRLATAFVKGDRDTISNITAETIFSPLQPIRPFTPNVVGRNWDYASGINLQFLPRGYGSGRIPFTTLRQFSRSCEVLRLALETVKDQIGALQWQVVPKEDSKASPDDPRIKEVTAALRKPDRVNTFEQWLRMALEEYMVTDALSIYRLKDRIGRPYSFEILDGATIKPLVDAQGRRPLPPDPAFQQIIKGAPRVDYDATELLYMPRNLLAYDPSYGLSIVEQIIVTIQMSIERAKYQLAYFTEGSLPDAYASLPEGMTPDQIREFEDRFNNMMKGNASARREVPFFPAGTEIGSLKQPPLKDEFDEWIARIVCYALGLSPTAFIRQMNRSTSENDQQRSEEEGQAPKMQYIKSIFDELLADFGEDFAAEFEFKWRENNKLNPDIQSQIEDRNVKNATKTINEVRAERGDDPFEGGDVPMVLTASGYVPLDSFAQNQQMQREAMAAQAKAKAEVEENGGDPNQDPKDVQTAEKSVYSRLGKGERVNLAIPFHDHSLCEKKKS